MYKYMYKNICVVEIKTPSDQRMEDYPFAASCLRLTGLSNRMFSLFYRYGVE